MPYDLCYLKSTFNPMKLWKKSPLLQDEFWRLAEGKRLLLQLERSPNQELSFFGKSFVPL